MLTELTSSTRTGTVCAQATDAVSNQTAVTCSISCEDFGNRQLSLMNPKQRGLTVARPLA